METQRSTLAHQPTSRVHEAQSSGSPADILAQSVNPTDYGLPIPDFDPLIHLNFQPPTIRHTFTELGLPVPKGVPDLSYTEPFQLFSEEGVRIIRREVFQRSFLDKYMRAWDRAPCVITAYRHDKEDGKFLKQAMDHPFTQAAIDAAFGCRLKLQSALNDMGYINVQLGAEGTEAVYELTETASKPLPPDHKLDESQYDDTHIDSWHKDQTPVVLVLMLSDTSTMVGGETAVRLGDGTIIKSRGANIGGAVMMAGGYLEHAALRATNCNERLSLVNSYAFADPIADDTATNLRSIHYGIDSLVDHRNVLMVQKLERLRARCDIALEQARERRDNEVEFIHSLANFSLYIFDGPQEGARELVRTRALGGTAVITGWSYPRYMDVIHQVRPAIRPDDSLLKPPLEDKWLTSEHTKSILRQEGFANVEEHSVDSHWAAQDLDSLGDNFTAIFGPIVMAKWTDEKEGRASFILHNVILVTIAV
ncbi:hypothetical protein FSARC_8781 [Fusarium sarcochroum]|uniref:Uncharacterized protein n=1 Tax=Fusarium sarcochroum TaxID=1208366 RepID=A0A8H4TSJ5_9HYPO|nr:hypothetical protein FSARC_8781 [Fusarium sarcochroum]